MLALYDAVKLVAESAGKLTTRPGVSRVDWNLLQPGRGRHVCPSPALPANHRHSG